MSTIHRKDNEEEFKFFYKKLNHIDTVDVRYSINSDFYGRFIFKDLDNNLWKSNNMSSWSDMRDAFSKGITSLTQVKLVDKKVVTYVTTYAPV